MQPFEHHHEPALTTCACGCAFKRIGENVSEKLDYKPGMFSLERHIRDKWACAKCETLVRAPVPAQVPIALGRPNWLFAESRRAGQRAAAMI